MSEINYQDAFNLLRKIVQNGENESFLNEISTLSNLINKTLPETFNDLAPANFPELYSNFKYTFEKFTDFIMFEKLIGKNTVALGGAFSSGKSSFINSLLGTQILPSDIDPSTSVPTYIISGNYESALGINVFKKKFELLLEEVKVISHGFTDEFKVRFGHLLETIFIETNKLPFTGISLLDTPGYSKPNSEQYSLKTDENIARTQLNASNYILWFVNIEEGTITAEDINFLKSLNKEIPITVIANKCDKRPPADVKNIISLIKETLEAKGIFPLDVISYSCRYPERFEINKVKELFAKWDKEDYVSTFARDFKILFLQCSDFFVDMIRNENKRLTWINTGKTFAESEEVIDSFNNLSNEIKIFNNRYKEKETQLKNIQKEFFTEIKIIGDKYGIEMPEPDEIDLIKKNTADILKILRQVKKEKNIKSEENYHILDKYFKQLSIKLNEAIGHKDYPKTIKNMFISHLSSVITHVTGNNINNVLTDILIKNAPLLEDGISKHKTNSDIIKSTLNNQ